MRRMLADFDAFDQFVRRRVVKVGASSRLRMAVIVAFLFVRA